MSDHSTPDPWLSEYFATGPQAQEEQPVEKISAEDFETVAALRMLEKDAAAKGIDLTQFTPEQILAAAQEEYTGQVKEAGEEQTQETQEEQALSPEEEFFQLHKFAGQVQAHALVSELRAIAEMEKEAESKTEAAAGVGRRVLDALKGAERKVSSTVGSPLTTKSKKSDLLGKANEGVQEAVGKGTLPKSMADEKAVEAYNKALGAEKVKRGRIAGGAAATTLAAGGVGAAALTGRKKEGNDSAVEQYIQRTMGEMLAENGWVNEAGEIIPPPEKTASEKTASIEEFDAAVQQEALRRLVEDYGYPTE